MHVSCSFFGERGDVQGLRINVDHRSTCDPDLGPDEIACRCIAGRRHLVGTGNRRNVGSGIGQTNLPERARRFLVRVEGINAVMLRDHVYNIADTLGRKLQVLHVEWLAVNRSIDGV